jgi:hypothetical protein
VSVKELPNVSADLGCSMLPLLTRLQRETLAVVGNIPLRRGISSKWGPHIATEVSDVEAKVVAVVDADAAKVLGTIRVESGEQPRIHDSGECPPGRGANLHQT